MSQSTPINLIRRGDTNLPPPVDPSLYNGSNMNSNGLGSNSQLVEDILKEIGESPGAENQSNINAEAFQHMMDGSHIPPNQYMPPPGAMPPQNQNDYNYSQKLYNDNKPNTLLSQFGINLSSETLKDKIMKNIKYPMLVFVICFIISLPEFNRFLFGFFPRLLLESGQVSFGGTLLKACVGTVIFTIIALFI
jgi:hypothetical protein